MNKPNIDIVVSGAKQAECTYKNVVLKGNHSFASQVTEPNTKYVIKYDFNLDGETVTIPGNCVLEFDGGSLNNGTIIGNETILVTYQNLSDIFIDISRIGTWKEKIDNISKETKINMFSSFTMFQDTLTEFGLNRANNAYKKMGINKIWLSIILRYDSVNNKFIVPSWYVNFHNLGGTITDAYKFIQKTVGWEIDCVKLHKNENIEETFTCANAYKSYCFELIDELQSLGIKKVFISNEEKARTDSGSVWQQSFMDIIDYAHSKGIKVGFSMNNYVNTINGMSSELFDKIDYPYENFYPELSYNDEKTDYRDLPIMESIVYNMLLSRIQALYKKKPTANYGFSECGTTCYTKALRYPYMSNISSLGEPDVTGRIFDIYWRAILNAMEKANIYDVANWFLDEHFENIKDNSLYFIKHKIM